MSTGNRFRALLHVTTDAGIDGWAEVETQAHALKAVVEAPGEEGALPGPVSRGRSITLHL
jgi:hypothetical protein